MAESLPIVATSRPLRPPLQRRAIYLTAYFCFARARLPTSPLPAVGGLAGLLRAHRPLGRIRVDGYTDIIGRPPRNLALSARRADRVIKALKASLGDDVRFDPHPHGHRDHAAPNRNPDHSDNPLGRALNRRVRVRVTIRARTGAGFVAPLPVDRPRDYRP